MHVKLCCSRHTDIHAFTCTPELLGVSTGPKAFSLAVILVSAYRLHWQQIQRELNARGTKGHIIKDEDA